MLSPVVFTPLIQRVTICSFFWLDATSKDSWQYVMWQVKAKQTNKKACEFNLKLYISARNLIFAEKKIQLTLHICISMDSIEGWKIFGKKNFMKFQKTQLEFASHLQLFTLHLHYIWAFLVAQTVKNLPAMQETWFDPWIGKIPWRRKWPPTPVFLPGEFHGQRSLAG